MLECSPPVNINIDLHMWMAYIIGSKVCPTQLKYSPLDHSHVGNGTILDLF